MSGAAIASDNFSNHFDLGNKDATTGWIVAWPRTQVHGIDLGAR
jgi:hypothetical protein